MKANLKIGLIIVSSAFLFLNAAIAQPTVRSGAQSFNFRLHGGGGRISNQEEKGETPHKSLSTMLTGLNGPADLPRLFVIPTADLLGSMDVNFSGGKLFGREEDGGLLGTISLGLGGVAEIELSTQGLIDNLTSGATNVSTSAFKVRLIQENSTGKGFMPGVAIALRTSTDWQGIESENAALDRASSFYSEAGIREVHYSTRFTELTLVGSKHCRSWGLHMGVHLTDVRTKDLRIRYYFDNGWSEAKEKQKNLIGGCVGVDHWANSKTKIMVEAETFINYEHKIVKIEDPNGNGPEFKQWLEVSQIHMVIGGVRFFFVDWVAVDTGVRYLSNFKGIADAQIRLGINVLLPLSRIDKP
jgi:hypothetical protein